jgi:transposase InsO family protein
MNYHANARTTQHQRKIIKESREPNRRLAKKMGVTPATVAKWKKRPDTKDRSSRPKNIGTAIPLTLYPAIEMLRKDWLCDMDRIWLALRKAVLPQLSRSSVYRHLVRAGLNDRKALRPLAKRKTGTFRKYPPGYLHVDVFFLPRLDGRRRYLFIAIDRATRILALQAYDAQDGPTAARFLQYCRKFYPFRVHRVLTDNGASFTNTFYKGGKALNVHPFDQACHQARVRHVLTKIKHPWTNGLAERTGGLIKEATVYRYHYGSVGEMESALYGFERYFNQHRPYKAMGGKTPVELAQEWFSKHPKRFSREPEFLYTTS